MEKSMEIKIVLGIRTWKRAWTLVQYWGLDMEKSMEISIVWWIRTWKSAWKFG